ncbi:MAG: hypothetical protein ACSHX6_15410 [Akkermansiaceae bacterium]
MALLMLIALAMLSLSNIEVKSASSNKGYEAARANARMSLLLALAELQKSAGSDTRITAPADAYSGSGGQTSKHVRQLTGVWRSWEGLNHDQTTGLPMAPDYDIKGVSYSEGSPESGRFLRWLVSGNTDNLLDPTAPPSLEEGSDTVPLLAEGTLKSESDLGVHVVPTEIMTENGDGAIAWWVQGENTKVKLKASEAAESTSEAVDQLAVSPGPSGDAFGIDDTDETGKVISQQSLTFLQGSSVGSDDPAEYFHDLSTHSMGLLTNNANGGWKRDLSLFSEKFANVSEGFSSFTLSPGNAFTSGKYNKSSATTALIYPWIGTTGASFTDSMSWAGLADHMTLYKRLRSSGNEVAHVLYGDNAVANQNQAYLSREAWPDRVRQFPVVARIHIVISLTSRQDANDSTKYTPAILLNPVITMWNPYSVALDTSSVASTLRLNLNEVACPVQFDFKIEDSTIQRDLGQIAGGGGNTAGLTALIPLKSPDLWLPGEVRVFSPNGTEIVNKNSGQNINYSAGYRPGSGLNYVAQDIQKDSTSNFSVTGARILSDFGGANVQGTGMYFTESFSGSGGTSLTNTQSMIRSADAQKMLGEAITLTSTSASSLSSLQDDPQPILSVITGLRYGRDTNSGRDNIVVNGIHNMNPAVSFTINGSYDGYATDGRFDVFPYNIQLFPVNSLADPGLPSGIENDLEGYLGSGFGSNDGLSNLILLESPNRPLSAIGDLQHFNINAHGFNGPYVLNALGNSRVSPFIKSDNVRVGSLSGSGANRGHDHSYVMNHVLLDDWFVSSIAPDMNDWSASEARSMEDVYRDHLTGDEALPSHYYKPEAPLGASEAGTKASEFISDDDAWEKAAAELEVEGMFNINSTSELAWEMLLWRNFSDGKASYLGLTDSIPGNTAAGSDLIEGAGRPFPRTMLTSDSSAGNSGYAELSQPREFTEDQIKALAREIVVEVKKRGPFLSVSEFYNRQLSSDVELAQAGAVESALLRLSEGTGNENPYRDLQTVFNDTATVNDMQASPQPLEYAFPEAAEGNPAYGFPGWTRQADVLRSISGILSARDDTFTIRAYGCSKDNTGKIIAEAWCEAVVSRSSDFVNGGDKYELPSDDSHPFGRKFVLKQFRWMNRDEV